MALRPRRRSITKPYASDSPILEQARTRYRLAVEAEEKQAARENDDLKFYDGDQWPSDIRALRAGRNAEGSSPAVPARPCLTVNKVKAPVQRVTNQERQSDLGIELVPADDFEALIGPIDDSEIELREGLVRRIQRTSEAQDARSWAFQRATIAGRGYYRVITRYLPGKTMAQEVQTSRIFNQGAVKLDPTHEQPDGSDADWGFVGAWMPWERYLAQWPKVQDEQGKTVNNPLKGYRENQDFESLTHQYPDWFRAERGPDGTQVRAIYVAEYIYCDYESRTLLELPGGDVVWQDEATAEEKDAAVDERLVAERHFTHCVIDGVHVLEETEWPIPYTGIVKVLGEEIQPYDAERRVEGMVRPSRDAQQGFNAMISKMVEVVAYAPIPPIMLASGQDEGFQAEYAAAMTRTIPVLHYNLTDAAGQAAPPPFSPPRNAPIEPVGFALSMFAQSIQDTTATHDTALGKTETNVTTARHARLLSEETSMSTSGFLDNLARSVRYEGLLINALLWHVYGRKPGRLAQLVQGDGETKAVLIGQPFTMDPRLGRPVPAPPGQGRPLPPGMPPPPGMSGMPNGNGNGQPPPGPKVQEYKLTEHARFNVAIKVSKSYNTRREQEHNIVGQVIAADPSLMQVIGDLFFKSMDGPGHQEMADRMAVMLAPPVQEYLAAKKAGQDPLPPQIQQQMAQAKQMIEGMTKQLQAMGQKLQTDDIKQQHETSRKQLDAQTKLQAEQLAAAADIEKAKVNAVLQITLLKMKMAQANLDREDTQAHEMGMASADAAHAAAQAEVQAQLVAQRAQFDADVSLQQADQSAGHAMQQTDQEAQLAAQQAQQGSQLAMEQAEHQQAIQPPPEAAAP